MSSGGSGRTPSTSPNWILAGATAGGVPTNLVKILEGLQFQPHPAFGVVMATVANRRFPFP